VTLTRSKVKVTVTGLLNFQQLVKPCMLAAMTAASLWGFLVFNVLMNSLCCLLLKIMWKFFGQPFVKRFTLCYWTVVCLSVLSCLSVTFVHCGQTVGWIKMKLGVQVGLGPGHNVLDRDPAPPPPKRCSPPNFRPISVAAKWLHGSRYHLVWS